MTCKLIPLSLFLLLSSALHAQMKGSDLRTTQLLFFADEETESPISEIEDGTMEFYVKAPLTKEMANLTAEHKRVELSLRWNDGREVYEDVRDLSASLERVGTDDHEVFRVTLDDPNKVSVFFDEVEKSENVKIGLEAQLLGGRVRNTLLASGSIVLDLSAGKDQYIEYILSKNMAFTFDGTDGFKDDELKVRVIADFERRWDITIHQFAWGERIPYTGDDSNYYRRQTAGMTYKEADGACYKSGVSVFDVTSDPAIVGYRYENDGTRFNPERIPCDRVKM